MNVVWFKRDLRTHDNPALFNAIKSDGPVTAVYILEPLLWNQPDMSYRHFLFLRDCLACLQQQLSAIGLNLIIITDEAVSALTSIHQTHGMVHLWSNQETWNGWTYARDKAVATWCKANNVVWTQPPQHGVVRCLNNRDGWAAQWAKRMNDQQLCIAPIGPEVQVTQTIPHASDLGLSNDGIENRQLGGHTQAEATLNQFLTERGRPYTKAMSSPVTAFDACSRLSTHLAFGTLSVRYVYQRAKARKTEIDAMTPSNEKKEWRSAMQSFLGRLRWHCHFIQKLEDEPSLESMAMHPMMRDLDQLPLKEETLHAWASGTTGFPMVDACMRALNHTGWINFRMRAMLMSVGAHHLQLPWQACAKYLATQFVDYEPGIHYSQCQMQAGRTGINAIRIYNPIKQGTDHDPSGVFVREWLPELNDVPDSGIHHPWLYGKKDPIVDEKSARQHAASILYAKKKGPEFKEAANRVYKKHGSRKRQ